MRIPTHLLGGLAALALSSVPAAAQGRWIGAYPETKNPVFSMMRGMLQEEDMLAAMIEPLNEHFPMPRDVTVEVAECGEAGAYYDPARPAVRLCYELMMMLAENLPMEDDGDEGGGEYEGAFVYILLHQVAHAIIDQLDLAGDLAPEEAADQFTALMGGLAGDELGGMLEGAILLSEMELDWENPGSGETALGGKRLENLVCLLYGSDPDAYDWVVEEGELSEARAGRCSDDFETMMETWETVLEEYFSN